MSQHFGRCPEYTIVDIVDGRAATRMTIPNPGHEPGFLPRYLADLGVSCIISGGMGPRAQDMFAEQGIRTILGVSGSIDEVITDFVVGRLRSGESLCDHPHEGQGECREHHGH